MLQCVLQLLEGSLLHHLGVLQPLYQFQLLHLHLGNLGLVLQPLRLVASHFLVHLLAGPGFLGFDVLAFLFLRVVLLLFDH